MMRKKLPLLFALLPLGCSSNADIERHGARADDAPTAVHGWLSWRGPLQTGASLESGLPDTVTVGGENHLWSYELAGRGTPVIANGRVYTMGYEGEEADLQEVLVCLDERTGEKLFERRHSDFLSDVVYNRYAISSPTIDPETGNVYYLTSPGLLFGMTADGEVLWEHSLMSEIGRPTYPNGRTGAPIIDGDLVIVHFITSNWGPNGPRRNRIYAFDKTTGELVWGCTPGSPPKDAPYSHPVLVWRGGERVLYFGTGCGNLVCVNARTGEPIWRYKLATGGINSSVLPYEGDIIAIHARENMHTSKIGGMLRLSTDVRPPLGEGPALIDIETELWRNDLVAFTSSPDPGGRSGLRRPPGDRRPGIAWTRRTRARRSGTRSSRPDQIHASPLYADGKLYVPMNNGTLPHRSARADGRRDPQTSCSSSGACLGAPAVGERPRSTFTRPIASTASARRRQLRGRPDSGRREATQRHGKPTAQSAGRARRHPAARGRDRCASSSAAWTPGGRGRCSSTGSWSRRLRAAGVSVLNTDGSMVAPGQPRTRRHRHVEGCSAGDGQVTGSARVRVVAAPAVHATTSTRQPSCDPHPSEDLGCHVRLPAGALARRAA